MAVAFSRLALNSGSNEVTVENAKVALRNFRRQPHTTLIVDDLEHINAYMALRGMRGRVTGEHMARYLETSQQTVSHGKLRK